MSLRLTIYEVPLRLAQRKMNDKWRRTAFPHV